MINPKDLNPDTKENDSYLSSIYTGIKFGTVAFPFKIITFELVYAVVSKIPFTEHRMASSTVIRKTNLIYAIVIGPLFEEAVVRLGIQTCIKKIQNLTKKFFPNWVNSPRFRVIATGIIFASLHLVGNKMNIATKVARITFLIIFPVESILFEKSGFVSACSAHATHNALVLILRNIPSLKRSN